VSKTFKNWFRDLKFLRWENLFIILKNYWISQLKGFEKRQRGVVIFMADFKDFNESKNV
jgi:hypothetical protein